MTEKRFNIVYYGQTRQDIDLEHIKHSLMQLFKLDNDTAEKLLHSRKAFIKKDVNRETAERLKSTLSDVGLTVAIETAHSVPNSLPSKPISTAANKIPFQFHGKGSEYFKIWLVNILLSIITLGIYSAWAKVRRKQYFYGNTQINGTGFQYLADPKNILKGRIIAFIIFVLYSVISELMPPLGLLLALVFMFLLPWLAIRAIAFNARNSSLRNIRFNFTGTYSQALGAFISWPLLASATLGILTPYAFYKQKAFIVENSRYGTSRFQFNATPGDYYVLVFKFIIPLVIGIALAVGASFIFQPISIVVIVVLYLYALAYFSVKSSNLLFNTTQIGPHGFEATMEVMGYGMVVLTNTLATVLTLGFFHPFAKVRALRYTLDHLALLPGGDLDQFVAAEQKQVSALGDELADFMDFDFGL